MRSHICIPVAMLAGLASCADVKHAPPPVTQAELPAFTPPPIIARDLPLEPPPEDPEQPAPQFCQLGTSCLAMDPHPFEACLLGSTHCAADAKPMLVTQPLAAESR